MPRGPLLAVPRTPHRWGLGAGLTGRERELEALENTEPGGRILRSSHEMPHDLLKELHSFRVKQLRDPPCQPDEGAFLA